jgi:hypothetical protein
MEHEAVDLWHTSSCEWMAHFMDGASELSGYYTSSTLVPEDIPEIGAYSSTLLYHPSDCVKPGEYLHL